jgi:NitT/TauT family transport system substrate-binding protein
VRLVRLARPKAPHSPVPAVAGASRSAARRHPRVLAAAAATLAVAGLTAGCSGGSGGTAGATGTITVAAIKGVDTAPLYAGAKAGGAFAKAGINVKIDNFTSVAAEISALRAGKVDVAAGDYVDFLYAESRQPGLLIVADGYHAGPGVMEALALPNSNITSAKDLIGKKVGTPEPQEIAKVASGAPYSLESLAAQSVLNDDNIDPSRVTWDPMPAGQLVKALADGQVNAIVVQEPYIYEAESQLGAIEVFDACSGATSDLPLSGYFSTKAYAKQNSPLLTSFRNELEKVQASAAEPGPVRTVLASESGMQHSASLMTIGSYPTTLNPASPNRVATLMFNFEVLTSSLNVSSMIFH